MKRSTEKISQIEKSTENTNSRNIKKNNSKGIIISASRLLSTLIFLTKTSLQQCTITETKAQGTIRIRKLAGNNTLLTVDHWAVHRVFSLTTNQVLYEIDLKPFFSQTGISETFIKGGIFSSDTEITMITDDNFYKFNMITNTMTKLPFYLGVGKNIRGSAVLDVRTSTYNFLGIKLNNRQCIFLNDNTYLGMWYPDQSGDPLYSKFQKISGVQTPTIWPQARIYGVTYPNMIGFFGFNGGSIAYSNMTETAWNNVTSNIAIKENQDVIAYGLNKTDFQAAVRFRTLSMNNRFIQNLDHPFIQCQFHPSMNYLVTYYVEGEVCLISYNLGSSSITITGCYPVAAPEFEIEFMNGKMVLFKESIIAVYNFPSVSLSHVYSPQPIFMNQLHGGTTQLHVFPGIKIRKFDTVAKAYNSGNLFEGNVLKAYINSHNTGEIFILEGLSDIKKIRFSDGFVLNTYDPVGLITPSISTTYRDCKLLGFDFYKNNNQLLISLYRCYRISDNFRFNLFIELNYVTNTVNHAFYTFTNDYLNQIRTGIHSSNDVIIASGARCSYYFQPSYSPFALNQLGGGCTIAYSLVKNLEVLNNNDIYVSLSMFTTYSFKTVTTGFMTKVLMIEGLGETTNCLPELSVTDTSVTPNILPQFYCGGSMFFRGDGNTHYNWGFAIFIKNEISGAIFRDGDGELYIQQNEGTRTKYTGNTMSCYRNDDFEESIPLKFSCGDSNCLECHVENGYYCRKCVNPLLAVDGSCLSTCPGGYYKLNDQCFQHCPLNYYKLGGAIPSCILDCSTHSTDKKSFGDRCTASCPTGSFISGSKCVCSAGKLAKEDLTCVTASGSDCPTGQFFWHHYEMCLTTVRNSTAYSVYNGKTVYCDSGHYVDFDNGFKCIPLSQCVSPRLTGVHPDYGNICVTATQCKTSLSYKVDTPNLKCLSSCSNYLHVSVSECVNACPGGTVYSPLAAECIGSCPSTPSQYYQTDSNYCKTKSECTGVEELYASVNDFKCLKPCGAPNSLLTPSSLECHSSCPSSPSLTYHLSSNSSCETSTVCTGINTPSQHYKTDSSQTCSTSCSVGLYKYDVDFSCLTAAQCQALSNGYTRNDTMTCISKAQCDSASRLTIESYSDCVSSCPNPLYSYSVTKTCETAAFCQGLSDGYTRNDTMTCISKAQCDSASRLTIESYNDCVSTCPTPLYSYLVTKTCETAAFCQGLSDGYTRNDTMTCISESECTTATRIAIIDYHDCDVSCPGGKYYKIDQKSCKTQAECQSSNYYTKNDSMTCIPKSSCNSFNYFTKESYKDCATNCPTGDYQYLTDKTCKTNTECASISNYYTRNDTMICVSDLTCTSALRLLVTSYKDCDSACPSGYYYESSQKKCLIQSECQQINYYTKNTTSECLTTTSCLASSSFLMISLKDCVNPCSTDTYFYSSNFSCLTQTECQTANFYTNNDTSECLNLCPPGKFFDESIKDCANSCPPELLGYSAGSQCLTEAQCVALGSEFWIDLTAKSCDNSCLKKKELNTKICYDECPGSLFDGDACFSQTEVEIIEIIRIAETEELEATLNFKVSDLDLNKSFIKKLEIKVMSNNSIENIGEFNFELENENQVKIKFETEYFNSEIETTFTFDNELLIKTKSNLPYAPKNYYILTTEIKKTLEKVSTDEENVPKKNGTETLSKKVNQQNSPKSVNALVKTHQLVIKLLPLIIPLTSSSSSSNLLTYIAQTFNKLIMYSIFTFKMTENVDNLYLQIFKDLMDEVSEFLVDIVKPGTSEKDKEYSCEKKTWRFCHVDVTVAFLTSQSIVLLFFILSCLFLGIFIILGKKWKRIKKWGEKIKTGTLPNLWIGNQLQLIFAIVLNMTSPILSSWFFILSYVISTILLVGFLYVGICLILLKRWEKSRYMKIVLTENFKDFIVNLDSARFFLSISFVFDLLMVTSIILFQNLPVIQALLWLLGQSILSFLTWDRIKFKTKIFVLRTRTIEVCFSLLTLLIFIFVLKGKENELISWGIFGLSCFILITDMAFSFILAGIEVIYWFKKKPVTSMTKVMPESSVRKSVKISDNQEENLNRKSRLNFSKKSYFTVKRNKGVLSKRVIKNEKKLINSKNAEAKPKINIIPEKIEEIKIKKKDSDDFSNMSIEDEDLKLSDEKKLDITVGYSNSREIDISMDLKSRMAQRSIRSMQRDLRIQRVKKAMAKKRKNSSNLEVERERVVYKKSLFTSQLQPRTLNNLHVSGNIDNDGNHYGVSEKKVLDKKKKVFTVKLKRKRFGNFFEKNKE